MNMNDSHQPTTLKQEWQERCRQNEIHLRSIHLSKFYTITNKLAFQVKKMPVI